MEDLRLDLAERLTEERVRLGFSLRDFAGQLEISQNGLRNYEAGQRGISAEFLAKAARCGVDVQYVLTGVRMSAPGIEKPVSDSGIRISSSNNVVGQVQQGATLHLINTNVHKTVVKADVKPGDEHITEAQAAKLTELVNEIAELETKLKKAPKSYRAIWSSLNYYMKVTKYRLIRLDDFERARKYLSQWIGRLNSMKTAPIADVDTWRKRKYAYIKINSKNYPELLDQYIKSHFGVASLTELSNDELDQTYRYVARRRTVRKK